MKKLLLALMVAGILSGCTEKAAPVKSEAIASLNNEDLYVAYVHGRENVFYDAGLFKEFLELGETSFRKTYIGAGTNGMTVIYGLTKADKKKATNPAEQMLKGELAAADNFYGEVFKAEENRFYVFTTWADFDRYVKTGVDNLIFSDIGAGPKGETVVYVLNSKNKKKKPVAAIAQFNANHNI
ncbi:MAG: hypothetical protein ISEC1_P0430 [Thiomicrorhabdus sp.]|nr:MAG: hypothetical protein ISEC1_P0430 [Thiomicrorhabdus sp.]